MSVADELHPVIHDGRVALITGAASGIGRAAAIEFAKSVVPIPCRFFFSLGSSHRIPRLNLKVAIADVDEARLKELGQKLASIIGEANLLVVPTDVAQLDQVVHIDELH